jgi:hypothetical protein
LKDRAQPFAFTLALCALTCALAPAYALRWRLGHIPTTVLEDVLLVTLLAFAVEVLRSRQPVAWRNPFLIPAVAFLVAGGVSVVTAPHLLPALGLFRAYLLEPMAFGAVVFNVVSTRRRALLVLGGLWAGATVAGLANSGVVLAAIARHAYEVSQTPPVVIYQTANAVALFVVPLAAVAGSLALHGKGLERPLGAAFFLVAAVVTLLSFSRGGYLALAAVVVGLALSHRRRLPLLGAAAAAAVLLFLLPPIRQRVLIETQNVYGNTVVSRLELWTATLNLLQERPLQGAGLAGFEERVAPFFHHVHTSASFVDPHNLVLNFWVETGLLGLLAMAWIIFLGFRVSWKGWRAGPEGWRPYQLGVLLVLVAVLVHGLVDVPYFKNDLSLEFWTLLAISAAAALPAAIGTGSRPAPPPPAS